MQKKHQIKSNTTSETKKDYLTKENDIWKSIQALDGLTTYVQDIILEDERYKSLLPPPPNHIPS